MSRVSLDDFFYLFAFPIVSVTFFPFMQGDI